MRMERIKISDVEISKTRQSGVHELLHLRPLLLERFLPCTLAQSEYLRSNLLMKFHHQLYVNGKKGLTDGP